MKLSGFLRHVGIVTASVVLLLGVPLWATGSLHSLFSVDPDAVSSASVILDQPSGNYIILINKALHTDEEKLNDWVTFFSGGDVLYIFEDIACSVASSDLGGVDLAASFRSRLPENQMQVKPEDGTLLLSRADQGLYDILIMSEEFADTFHAYTAYSGTTSVNELESAHTDSTELADVIEPDMVSPSSLGVVRIELRDIPAGEHRFHTSFARVYQ